jgi:excisionase family DNA binding protein
MTHAPDYLTLKRAAQVLGVHRRTLLSWEQKGLIRIARLPQSGYRRVPAEEVKRLQGIMLAGGEPAGVRLAPPRRDAAALAEADALAHAVRADLSGMEPTLTFAELMLLKRGRTWLP